MRYMSRAAVLLLLMLGGFLAIGCSESRETCTCPPEHDHPSLDGDHLWSKSFGDAENQTVQAVAVDASGNVIIVGFFWGTVDFGGGALTSASSGNVDIFVAKFGSDGTHLWSKRFGDGSGQSAKAIAVDASGNVIVTGDMEGTVNFGGGELTSAGYRDIFVAKFDPDGAHLWSKCFSGENYQEGEAVAVDVSGNVIIAGYFEGTVDFGGGTLTSAGANDVFVAKFDSDGGHLWSKCFGDWRDQRTEAIAVDASGNVIIAGYFEGTVDFGGGALTSAGANDIFVAKFGSDGGHLWSERFGDSVNQMARAVAVDALGNVIVTGEFGGAVDFGGGALTSSGGWDIFVAKFGPDGTHLWSERFGDSVDQAARAVSADASGNVIVTGYIRGTVNFGGGGLGGAVNVDIFIAKFCSDGIHLWSKRCGNNRDQFAEAVATDASGNVIVTGSFEGILDFDHSVLVCPFLHQYDIFVAKFSPYALSAN